MKTQKILLVNEAGCFDPGIVALAKQLSKWHRVCIVAPLSPSEGNGAAVTIMRPIRARQFFALSRVKIFGVTGTPVDCVTLALDKLLHSRPDIIICGIDHKNNRGETIYSSGVVSAAIAGTIQGIPSIAVSADIAKESRETEFNRVARAFMRKLPIIMRDFDHGTTLNVNFPRQFNPNRRVDTHLTTQFLDNQYTHEVSPFGTTFYWMKNPVMGHSIECLDQQGDIYWLKKNYITMTRLKYDLTDYDVLVKLNKKSGIVL